MSPCHLSPSPLPCHSVSASSNPSVMPCTFATRQSSRQAGRQWASKGKEAWGTGSDPPEKLAPHNMDPQSVPIIFLQPLSPENINRAIPGLTVTCILRKGNQRSLICTLDYCCDSWRALGGHLYSCLGEQESKDQYLCSCLSRNVTAQRSTQLITWEEGRQEAMQPNASQALHTGRLLSAQGFRNHIPLRPGTVSALSEVATLALQVVPSTIFPPAKSCNQMLALGFVSSEGSVCPIHKTIFCGSKGNNEKINGSLLFPLCQSLDKQIFPPWC